MNKDIDELLETISKKNEIIDKLNTEERKALLLLEAGIHSTARLIKETLGIEKAPKIAMAIDINDKVLIGGTLDPKVIAKALSKHMLNEMMDNLSDLMAEVPEQKH